MRNACKAENEIVAVINVKKNGVKIIKTHVGRNFSRFEVKVPPVIQQRQNADLLKYAEYGVVLLHCDAKLIQLKLIGVSARGISEPRAEKANNSTPSSFSSFLSSNRLSFLVITTANVLDSFYVPCPFPDSRRRLFGGSLLANFVNRHLDVYCYDWTFRISCNFYEL